jgi:hypothetical protein
MPDTAGILRIERAEPGNCGLRAQDRMRARQ